MKTNTVQQTLLFPLIGRYYCTKYWPDVFKDEYSKYIVEKMSVDTSKNDFGKISNILYGLRHNLNLVIAKEYIKKYPNAHIINMGCGLDNIFDEIDNGKIRYYNLDFPEVINLRNEYFITSDREKNIACSITDHKWMDEIDFKIGDGALLLAAGVFYYLHIHEVKELINKISEKFPEAQLSFDNESPFMIKKSNEKVKEKGVTNAEMYFIIDDPYSIKSWNPKIKDLRIIKDFSFNLKDKKLLPFNMKALVYLMSKTGFVYQVIVDFE